ncbi:MAG: Tetratricopeptide 2 repeat protein [Verrucomicrobiales bacterium]|nr:Tetratricopeptide 2 repeat protein [Verrucomicrobiales bacterium]
MKRHFSPSNTTGIVAIVLVAVTWALYWPSLQFEFISFDDPEYVAQNPFVQHGITLSSLKWAFTSSHAWNWHPVTWVSHMIDCQLFGLNAGAHHGVNVFFHSISVVLLFLIGKKITNNLWASAIVAALFGWHPLRVESVAWVSERKDVLSVCFAMLTLFFYVRHNERLKKGSGPWTSDYFISLFCFLIGLLAKPMLVTFPMLLLLLDIWPFQRIPRSDQNRISSRVVARLIFEKIPFLILVAGSFFFTLWAQHGLIRTLAEMPLSIRFQNAAISVYEYVQKLIFPLDLCVLYPLQFSWPVWKWAVTLLLLIGMTFIAFRYFRKFPIIAVGWFWFLGALVPVIGIVQVGTQAFADRYSYLPTLGLIVVAVWTVGKMLPRNWSIGVGMLAIVFCLIITHFQLQYWQNSVVLFTRAVDVTRHNPMAYNSLATAVLSRGNLDEAIAIYKEALIDTPNDPEIRYLFGQLLARVGKKDEAIKQFKDAIEINPRYFGPWLALIPALIETGNLEDARYVLNEAQKYAPPWANVELQRQAENFARRVQSGAVKK